MAALLVELYGVLRLRAGRDTIPVEATTVGGALAAAEAACPTLAGVLLATDGTLRPEYRVAINGGVVGGDPETRLGEGDSLVILSAHAGG